MAKKNLLSVLLISVLLAQVVSACQGTLASSSPSGSALPREGAFKTGKYRNLFKEMLSKSDTEIQSKLDAAWKQLFYGNDASQRVYYPVDPDMAYIEDIGNADVRTEGMSYGMMIAVQMDKKPEFDRLWKWAMTYMYQKDGPYKGYFAWHCDTSGKKLDGNPASDGEEWFVMALFFADARWGSGQDIFNYRAEAQAILNTMLHKDEENSELGTNMFNLKEKQVVFVPKIGRDSSFTDPSYHLPAYYELWALGAAKDKDFWAEAAKTSRAFLKKTANPKTGLMPNYAEFSGAPREGDDYNKDFRFDSFRNASNVAVDYAWFAADPWEIEQSNRLLEFFSAQGMDAYVNQYELDGKPLSSDRSPGLIASNAVAALASTSDKAPEFVKALWNLDVPQGKWRYYDGMLYMLALLHASGNFHIYRPQS
jgi:oligosaccharide reducing-end xylanase